MNEYKLTESEILSSLITNNKDRFIKSIDWENTMIPLVVDGEVVDGGFKTRRLEDVLDFFHSHANLENKIDWNEKDHVKLATAIDELISETYRKAEEREERKVNIKSLFTDSDNFKILGEDENFIYVAPLTHEGAVFMDSYNCGGQGATWCIGMQNTSNYWNNYVNNGSVFVLMMKKPNARIGLNEALEPVISNSRALNGRYWEDNKVMFEIESDGFCRAWEQEDDFQMFYQPMETVIERCGLGLEWNNDVHEELHNKLNESDNKFDWSNCAYVEGDNLIIDFEPFREVGGNPDDLNDYILTNNLSRKSLITKGVPYKLYEVIQGYGIESVTIGEMNTDGLMQDSTFIFGHAMTYMLECLDLSNLNDDNFCMSDGMFIGLAPYLKKIILDANATETISRVKEFITILNRNIEIEYVNKGE